MIHLSWWSERFLIQHKTPKLVSENAKYACDWSKSSIIVEVGL